MAAANHCGRIAACCLALLRYGHVEWVTASVATTHRAGDEPSLLRGRGGERLARPRQYGFPQQARQGAARRNRALPRALPASGNGGACRSQTLESRERYAAQWSSLQPPARLLSSSRRRRSTHLDLPASSRGIRKARRGGGRASARPILTRRLPLGARTSGSSCDGAIASTRGLRALGGNKPGLAQDRAKP